MKSRNTTVQREVNPLQKHLTSRAIHWTFFTFSWHTAVEECFKCIS